MPDLPRIAETDSEIARCFDVMVQLRPHLQRAGFVAEIRRLQQDGFQLAYHEVDGQVVAVTGFRISSNLHLGRHLYVDDLVTDAAQRSHGYGGVLLDWLTQRAIEASCAHLHLDSGIQREGAHRFYLSHGLALTSFHFDRPL
jgi:GNAT superfamily N-acetyltransferase